MNGRLETRFLSAALTLMVGTLAACAGATPPPQFALLPGCPPPAALRPPAILVGSPHTPPPGVYRFARMDRDGRVEVRELHTHNGPGPWLTYVEQTCLPPALGRELWAAASGGDASASPDQHRGPCVLGAMSADGPIGKGCTHRALAARLLDIIPRLSPPDAPPACRRPGCQVRLLRGTAPHPHEAHGRIDSHWILDEAGGLWCARREPARPGEPDLLRVERRHMAPADAARLLAWLLAGIDRGAGTPAAPAEPYQPVNDVLIAGPGNGAGPLGASAARSVQARWGRLSRGLPPACQDGPALPRTAPLR
jgi:hypothetical protein